MHISRPVITTRFTRFCLAVGTLSGIAALGLGGQAAWADSTTCTPPANGPSGPGASTFTYQCVGTYAGDWTNTYYVYDPATGAQTALYSPDYSYDCATGTWTKAEWDYDAGSGGYVESRVAATAPPDQPTNCSTVNTGNAATTNAGSGNATNTPATAPDSSTPATGSSTGNTTAATAPPDPTANCTAPTAVPDTSNPAPVSASNNGTTMKNNVCSDAQSGIASVTDNHHAGDATSGNATDEVNVANLVDSTSSTTGSGAITFTKDINGNVNGDLVLDPSAIGATTSSSDPNSTVGTVNTDASIENAITATAVSGDATVSGNGTGGDAASGNAEAIVNLINMINSAIASGKSFVGTINIYGNLNGNILIPQSVIDQLLASNAAGGAGVGASNLSNNESITNNVNAGATSGGAAVTNNNVGGNATSGDAKTNVTILNLTGSSIVGKNVLLVFVNVLGQWVGMIMNAPTGATSAEFGGGITSDAPGAGNNAVEAGANLSITNNVNANAASGNATVANNWMGGNATSGNADTAVNILNVENSSLSLANWFGVLFINVFGTWNGNFGIQSAAAPVGPSSSTTEGSSTASGTYNGHHYFTPHHFATFIASAADSATTTGSGDAAGVLGDTVSAPMAHEVADAALPASSHDSHANYVLPALGLLLALSFLAGAERDRLLHRKK